MKKRLILGDIHGHIDFVKQIYEKETPTDVIILGDYCDSYKLKPQDIEYCWDELIDLKDKHKYGEFHLLIGNHDLHYMLTSEEYSGKNYLTQVAMHEKLMNAWDNKILEPYIIYEKNKTIYSHAGITKTWCEIWEHNLGDEVNLDSLRFTFGNTFNCYGDCPENGFVWVRPSSLYVDRLDGYKQIVGHTVTDKPVIIGSDENNKPYSIDINNNEKITSNGVIFILDTLPFWYMIETLDNNGNIVRRELKRFREFDKNYRQ